MANWKKVIVSGSNAELNQVTASFFSGDGSALTNVPAGSINIESFTDGTGITVATTDKLILSDAGDEKYINVSQLPFTTANVSTNLSKTVTASNVTINSSDGDNIAIGAASTSAAGVLTKAKFDEIVANTAKNTNVKAIFDEHVVNKAKVSDVNHNVTTNLSTAAAEDTVTIKSSDGTNAEISAATTSAAGIMTTALFDILEVNKAKVSNVSTNLSKTATASNVTINSSDGTNVAIGAASTSAAGVMTKAVFDAVVLNTAKVTNTDVNVSVANLKTKLAGPFASNAVSIGDSTDVVTIGNKLVVTGDLTVSGTTTTVDTANLNVTDQFINLNDGGEAADGGIVIEGAGASFGWDNSAGRWAFDLSGATEGQTSIASDAFAVSVHTGNVGAQVEGYQKDGNMYIDKLEDIWIYTE